MFLCIALAIVGCNRTAPQKPSQRSSESPKADSAMMALMEINQRMASQADKELLEQIDSLTKADGREWARMNCSGWKIRRDEETKQKTLYSDNPKPKETWQVRVRVKHLDGQMAEDTECAYAIRSYKLPIAVEEALEDMCSGEKTEVYAPWYCAYGIHGNDLIEPYESVKFEIYLGEKQ